MRLGRCHAGYRVVVYNEIGHNPRDPANKKSVFMEDYYGMLKDFIAALELDPPNKNVQNLSIFNVDYCKSTLKRQCWKPACISGDNPVADNLPLL